MCQVPPPQVGHLPIVIVPGQLQHAAAQRSITPNIVYGNGWVYNEDKSAEDEFMIEMSLYYKSFGDYLFCGKETSENTTQKEALDEFEFMCENTKQQKTLAEFGFTFE